MNQLGKSGVINNSSGGSSQPSGILFNFPVGYQYTSFYTGDVGYRRQIGWFDIVRPTNPAVICELDETLGSNFFWQLKTPLTVGGVTNAIRFVDVNGVQTWGAANNVNLITIDKFTGLGFYRQLIPSGVNWQTHIDNILAMSYVVNGVTFDSFYMMSLEEYLLLFGNPNIGASKITDKITLQRYFIGQNVGYMLSSTPPGLTTNCDKSESLDYNTVIAKTNTTQQTIAIFDARHLISI